MRVTPNKCVEDSAAEEVHCPQEHEKVVKINIKHFKEKRMRVDDIDVNSLPRPIRSSTPTPLTDTLTIMAGNLDILLEDEHMESTLDEYAMVEPNLPISDELDSDESLKKYITVHKTKPKTPASASGQFESNASKEEYCKGWVQQQQGVSTNNGDAPPSLYASSINLADSLMDITSVSRNVPSKNYC